MPKNIPGIVQRRGPRQEVPVAIRIQPPQFPVPEATPSNSSEPSMAPQAAQYAGPMASSFSPASAPIAGEQYGGQLASPPSMSPTPQGIEQYARPMAPASPSLAGIQPQMAPASPSLAGIQPQATPPIQAVAPDTPAMPAAPSGLNKEAVPANAPLTRRGMLSSRGFMPSGPGGNTPSTPPSPTVKNNPPTPLPPIGARNPLTPLPPVNSSSATTLRSSAPSGGPLAQNNIPATPAPVGAMGGLGQQAPRQGQPPLARILIELDGKVTGEVVLQKPTLTVGRLGTSDICIPSKRISRHHAQILAEQGAWVMEDAGSVNGLFYNGSHVKRLVLNHGDRVRLAPDVSLVYEVMR
jgi:hypothetical protein